MYGDSRAEFLWARFFRGLDGAEAAEDENVIDDFQAAGDEKGGAEEGGDA